MQNMSRCKAVKSCALELKDIHPDHVDDKTQALIADILEAPDNESLLRVLNAKTTLGEAEQLDMRYLPDVIEKLEGLLLPVANGDDPADDKPLVIGILRFLSCILKNSIHKRYFLIVEAIGQLLYSPHSDIVHMAVEVLFYFSMPSMSVASYDADSWKETTEISSNVADIVLVVFESLGFMSPNYGILDFLRGQEPLLCPSEEFILDYPLTSGTESQEGGSGERIKVLVKLPPPPMEPIVETPEYVVAVSMSEQQQCTDIIQMHPALTEQQKLSVRHVIRVANLLHSGNIQAKLRMLTLRLRLFYILIHSHIPMERLNEHIVSGSPLLKDLVTMSDITSGAYSSIDFTKADHDDESCRVVGVISKDPLVTTFDSVYPIATLALDCLVGLLESSLYRRKQALRNTGLLQELGVIRNTDTNGAMTHDLPWYAVLLAACSSLTSSPHILPCGEADAELNIFHSDNSASLMKRTASDHIAEYVQVSIELFTACLAIVDYKISGENAAIGTIVGLIQNSLPRIAQTLQFSRCLHGSKPPLTSSVDSSVQSEMIFSKYETLIAFEIWPVVKALQALEGALGAHKSRDSVFRESNGMSMLTSLLDIIAANLTPKLLETNSSCNELLINVFSLMTVLIGDNAHRHRVNNAADSGVQLMYQPSFSAICQYVLHIDMKDTVSSPVSTLHSTDVDGETSTEHIDEKGTDNDTCKDVEVKEKDLNESIDITKKKSENVSVLYNTCLLSGMTELYSSAIDAEPQFLANFLRQPACQALLIALAEKDVNVSPLFSATSTRDSMNPPGTFLLEVLHLMLSMCITREGKECIRKSRLINQVIISVTHPNVLIPTCEGITVDILHSIGQQLGQLIRDDSSFAMPILSNIRASLVQICQEAQISSKRAMRGLSTSDFDSTDVESDIKHDKIMQKLVNICSIVEKINLSNRNSVSTQNLRTFFESVDIFPMLISTYACTLPNNPRKLFAQVTTHHLHSSTRTRSLAQYGDYYAAKALTSIIKIASGVLSHVMLPSLYKAIDKTLVESNKYADKLRLLHAQSLNTTLSNNSSAIFPDEVIPVESAPISFESAKLLSSGKNKGSRKGEVASSRNVIKPSVLNVLDCYPDDFIYTNEYSNKVRSKPADYEHNMSGYLKNVITLEWMSVMFTQFLRSVQQVPSTDPHLILTGKNVMLRLFDFYNSSLLEVCRVATRTWQPQPLCKSYSTPSGPFNLTQFCENRADASSTNEKKDLLQKFPQEYHIRVIISSGAIIREGTEIDGSRIVLLAPRGSTTVAYERRCTSGGIIRYRTAHGWLSEFQRDFRRDPIIEVYDTVSSSPVEGGAVDESFWKGKEYLDEESFVSSSHKRDIQACSLRDAASNVMSRAHAALRVVLTQLSHSIVSEGQPEVVSLSQRLNNTANLRSSLSVTATLLATSLSGVMMSAFTDKSLAKKSLGQGIDQMGQSLDQSNLLYPPLPPSDKEGEGEMNTGKHDKEMSDTKVVTVDAATTCLYIGAIVKMMLLPSLDDKNGQTNTFLLLEVIEKGVLDSFMKSFSYIVKTLHEGIQKSRSGVIADQTANYSGETYVLSPEARCALHSLTPCLSFLHKIVNYSALLRAPVTKLMERELKKSSPQQPNFIRQFHQALLTAGQGMLPIFQSYCIAEFPVHVQNGWMAIVADLITSIKESALALLSSMEASAENSKSSILSVSREKSEMVRHLSNTLGVERTSRDAGNGVADIASESDLDSDDDSDENEFEIETARESDEVPEESLIQAVIDMGFSRPEVLRALRTTRSQDIDVIVEYLFTQAFLHSTVNSESNHSNASGERSPSISGLQRSNVVGMGNEDLLPTPPSLSENSQGIDVEVEVTEVEDRNTTDALTNPQQESIALVSINEMEAERDRTNLFSVLDNNGDSSQDENSVLEQDQADPQQTNADGTNGSIRPPSRQCSHSVDRTGFLDFPQLNSSSSPPSLVSSSSSSSDSSADSGIRCPQMPLFGSPERLLSPSSRRSPRDSSRHSSRHISSASCLSSKSSEKALTAALFSEQEYEQKEYALRISSEMEKLVKQFSVGVVPYIRQTWIHANFVLRWNRDSAKCAGVRMDAPVHTQRDLTSASLISNFTVNMNNIFRKEVSVEDLLLLIIAENLETVDGKKTNRPCTDESLYGRLLFFLSMLRNANNRSHLEPFLTPSFVEKVTCFLTDLLDEFSYLSSMNVASDHSESLQDPCPLPPWVSVCLLICFDLASSSRKKAEVNENDINDDVELDATQEQEESKDDISLQETKEVTEVADAIDMSVKIQGIVDSTSLLPEHSLLSLYRVLERILHLATGTVDSTSHNKRIELGIDGIHASLLLLSALLCREPIADRFVNDSNGLQSLFQLTLPDNFNSSLQSSDLFPSNSTTATTKSGTEKVWYVLQSLLSLVIRRCFETKVVLKMNMKHEIKHVLRHAMASTVSDDGEVGGGGPQVTLQSFLYLCADFIMRDANIFLAIIREMGIKFLRKRSNSADKSTFVVLSTEGSHQATTDDAEPFPGSRALVTLSICVNHIVSSVSMKEDDEPAAKLHLFSAANCLHALCDSALTLKGLPQLLSKYEIVPPNDDSGVHPSNNLVAYLIKNVIPKGTELTADCIKVATPSGRVEQCRVMQGGARLLAALSAHKGLPMRTVLDSLVKALASLINFEEKVGSGNVNHAMSISSRLKYLSRVSGLLTHVITSCRPQKRSLEPSSSHAVAKQHVSIDAMFYLNSCGVALLLSQILASYQSSLASPEATPAVDSVLDLLEMFTRPKFLHHLAKMRCSASGRVNNKTDDSSATAVAQGTHLMTSGVPQSLSQSTPSAIINTNPPVSAGMGAYEDQSMYQDVESNARDDFTIDLTHDSTNDHERLIDRNDSVEMNSSDHVDFIHSVVNAVAGNNGAEDSHYHVDEGDSEDDGDDDDDDDDDNDDENDHDVSEIDVAEIRNDRNHEHSRTGLCFAFISGNCEDGDECVFSHGNPPMQPYHVEEHDDDDDDEDEDEDGEDEGDRSLNVMFRDLFDDTHGFSGLSFNTPPDQVQGASERWLNMFQQDDESDSRRRNHRSTPGQSSNNTLPWMMNTDFDRMELEDMENPNFHDDVMIREMEDMPYSSGRGGGVGMNGEDLEFGNTLLEFIRRTAPTRMMQQMHTTVHQTNRGPHATMGRSSHGNRVGINDGDESNRSGGSAPVINDQLLPGGIDSALQVNWQFDHPIIQNAQTGDRIGIGSGMHPATGGSSDVDRHSSGSSRFPARLSDRHGGFNIARPPSSSSLTSSYHVPINRAMAETSNIEDVFDALLAFRNNGTSQASENSGSESNEENRSSVEPSNSPSTLLQNVTSTLSALPSPSAPSSSTLSSFGNRMRSRERGMRNLNVLSSEHSHSGSSGFGVPSATQEQNGSRPNRPAVIVTADTQGWLFGVSRRDTNAFYELVGEVTTAIECDSTLIEEESDVVPQPEENEEVDFCDLQDIEEASNVDKEVTTSSPETYASPIRDVADESERLNRYFPSGASSTSSSDMTALTNNAVAISLESSSTLVGQGVGQGLGPGPSHISVGDAQALGQMFADLNVSAIMEPVSSPANVNAPINLTLGVTSTLVDNLDSIQVVTDTEGEEKCEVNDEREELPQVEYVGMGSDENESVLEAELIAELQEQTATSSCDEGQQEQGVNEESAIRNVECLEANSLAEHVVLEETIMDTEGVVVQGTVQVGDSEEVVVSQEENSPSEVNENGLVCPPGYDVEVFNSLPDFMQQEILDTYVETSEDETQSLLEAAGYDMETIAALPESIRMEIVEQIRQQQALEQAVNGTGDSNQPNPNPYGTTTDSGGPSEIDNVSFLTSLSPELREEVLLTSDPAFIATLSPELVAEAEALRERAAVQWNQHVEPLRLHGDGEPLLVDDGREEGRRSGFPPMQLLRSHQSTNGHGNLCSEFRASGSCRNGDVCPFVHQRSDDRNGNSNSSRHAVDEHLGQMRLEQDDVKDLFVPTEVLAAIINVMYMEKIPIPTRQLHRLLFNLTKQSDMRTTLLHVMMALLSSSPMNEIPLLSTDLNGTPFITSCNSALGPLPAFRFPLGKLVSNVTTRMSPIVAVPESTKSPNLTSGVNHHDEDINVQVPSVVGKRLLSALAYLIQFNRSFVYDILRGRVHDHALLSCLAAQGWGSDSCDDDDDGSDDIAIERKVNINTKHGSGSGKCYLELLVRLLQVPNYANNAAELLQLTTLINTLCEPLELLLREKGKETVCTTEDVDGATETINEEEEESKEDVVSQPEESIEHSLRTNDFSVVAPATASMPDANSKVELDNVQDISWVDVPHVTMSRPSLRCLCDVLLSDLCTREVFDQVVSSITRLSRVSMNQDILIDVIVEVSSDLTSLSLSYIEHALEILNLSHQEHKTSLLNSKEINDSSSGSASVQVSVPQLSLQVGDIGGQHHIRLLRALQILQNLTDGSSDKSGWGKDGVTLVGVAPLEELQQLWMCTDSTLRRLSVYVDKEDKKNKAGDSAVKNKQHSGVSSLLTKILPIVESFFLLHASDLLSLKAVESTDSTTKVDGDVVAGDGGVDVVINASLQGSDVPSLSPTQQNTPNAFFQLSRQQSLPGTRYRQGEAFARLNISLNLVSGVSSGGSEGDLNRGLSRGRSLLSLGSMDSSGSLASLGGTTSFSSASGYTQILNKTSFRQLSRPQRLLAFVHTHRNILNILIRANPDLLDGSLAALARISQLRSYLVFDNKRSYFYSQLKKRKLPRGAVRSLHLQIRRDSLFEDSFHQLRFRTPDEMKGRLVISFHDEEGIDAGGLTREWYMILSREIFNPNYCLFTRGQDGSTFQPNPLSGINQNHLDYFKFAGRVFGKAVVDGQLLDGHFTRSFYKHLLGVPIEYSDIEGVDPDYYKSLSQILDYNLEDIGVELTFSADVQTFGRNEVVDLIPNGRNIAVTDSNKIDYIRLISHHRLTSAIRSQIDNFLEGFHDLVPAELVSMFSPPELELLISGLPDIDIDELRIQTEYVQYRSTDNVILWFWDALYAFSREEKAMFLQFVTGTSKVPLDGFENLQGMRGTQKFNIHRAYGDAHALPSAHTCFNQLDLPDYGSHEELRDKLLMAIKEGSEGFGFG